MSDRRFIDFAKYLVKEQKQLSNSSDNGSSDSNTLVKEKNPNGYGWGGMSDGDINNAGDKYPEDFHHSGMPWSTILGGRPGDSLGRVSH